MNELKNMVEKKSYTIVLNNQLERKFDSPLGCENYEIALLAVHANNENLFIVNDSNNKLLYKTIDSEEWKEFAIPKGCMSTEEIFIHLYRGLAIPDSTKLFLNIIETMEINIDGANKNEMYTSISLIVPQNLSINIKPNSILTDIGFEAKIYPPKSSTQFKLIDNRLKITSLINIHLNCIQNNYFNEEESPIIYSFFQQENKINEKPSPLIYYPIKEKIKHFKVEIKDIEGNDVGFCNTYLKFHVQN